MEIQQLREEAKLLLKQDEDSAYALRSCWVCNPCHGHLKR